MQQDSPTPSESADVANVSLEVLKAGRSSLVKLAQMHSAQQRLCGCCGWMYLGYDLAARLRYSWFEVEVQIA